MSLANGYFWPEAAPGINRSGEIPKVRFWGSYDESKADFAISARGQKRKFTQGKMDANFG